MPISPANCTSLGSGLLNALGQICLIALRSESVGSWDNHCLGNVVSRTSEEEQEMEGSEEEKEEEGKKEEEAYEEVDG